MDKDLRNYFLLIGVIVVFCVGISFLSGSTSNKVTHAEKLQQLEILERKVEIAKEIKYIRDDIETKKFIDSLRIELDKI